MDYNQKPKGYYDNVRYEMLQYLPDHPKTIMEVGCGDGSFGKLLKEHTRAEVWGIEYVTKEAIKAKEVLDKAMAGPIEEIIHDLPDAYFDVVYFNDVLEHLRDPFKILEIFKEKIQPGGIVISSIPNIRYHNALIPLLVKKDFKYQEYGVMDFTHLRFFTRKSIRRMYEEQGYQVRVHEGINRSKSLKPILYNIPLFFTQTDIFYPQFATVAQLPS